MALYDTPPSIDPRTGRLPTYKQVLKQDPTTGVYTIKYEYTPIVSASTDGVDLQKMLTTPITELDVDPVTSDDKDDDTGEDTTTATQMTTTGSGGGPRGNDPRGEGPFVGGGAGGFNADNAVDPNSLEGLMSSAYPGTGAKVANFVFGRVLSGVNPLLGAGLGFLNQANQEKAEQKIKDQIEDGTIAKGLSTSQIEALAEDKNIPGYLSDAFSNILDSSGMIPTRRPTQPGATTPQDVGALTTDLFSGSITERREGEEAEAAEKAAEAAKEKAALDELERRQAVERQLKQEQERKQEEEVSNTLSLDAQKTYNNLRDKGFSHRESIDRAENTDKVKNMGSVGTGYDSKTGTYSGTVKDKNGSDVKTKDDRSQDDKDRTQRTGSGFKSDKEKDTSTGKFSGGGGSDSKGDKNTGSKDKSKDTDKSGGIGDSQKKSGGGTGGGGGRVICTELYRQGLMPKEDWRLDLWYTQNYLSRRHIIGYWYYAIPMVKIMRKNKVATNVWKHIAINRTKDIKWRLNKGKFNLLGRVYSIALETTANILGYFVEEKDYNILYKGEK